MTSGRSVRPVETLRGLVTALEAALTAVAAKATPRAVHRLRTTIRRIEAQIELLSLLPDLRVQGKQAKKAVALLVKLRKAAGRVRDLDVQRKLIASTPASHSNQERQLRKILEQQRGEEEKDLLNLIGKDQSKLAKSLEALIGPIEATKPPALPSAKLNRLVRRWYRQNTPAVVQSSEQMHAVRKAAKLARYMAEQGSKSNRLVRIFEQVQDAGGHWHDWLTLAEVARNELGPSSPLAQSFAQRCERALREYKRQLEALPGKLSNTD